MSSPTREKSLALCLAQALINGRDVRSDFAKKAQLAKIQQFPCILHRDGSIGVDAKYLDAVRDVMDETSSIDTSGLAWTTSVNTLPNKKDLMQKLGITLNAAKTKITDSSHGEVWLGSVTLPTGKIAHVAVKFMPVQPKAADETMLARITNSAYVDPFISWLGSQLVAKQLSTSFAHLYGTFVCQGRVHCSRGVSRRTPLVAMVTELLGEKIDVCIEACFPTEGGIKWMKLIAIILQVMLALSHAHAMTFVHNDAHMGNFLVAKECHHMPLYVDVSGRLLHIPVEERVVLMDFGRSTVAALDYDSGQCSATTTTINRAKRLQASEVVDKFAEWELDEPGADVTHFIAMVILCQPRANMLVDEAASPVAPPHAKALVRLMQNSLQCDTAGGGEKDMFHAYGQCNAEELGGGLGKCGKHLIHELRNKKTRCRGILPIDFLQDPELTAPFLVTEPIPPTEVIYLPQPVF